MGNFLPSFLCCCQLFGPVLLADLTWYCNQCTFIRSGQLLVFRGVFKRLCKTLCQKCIWPLGTVVSEAAASSTPAAASVVGDIESTPKGSPPQPQLVSGTCSKLSNVPMPLRIVHQVACFGACTNKLYAFTLSAVLGSSQQRPAP